MSQLIERLREAHDNFAGLEGVSNDDLVAVLDAATALTQPPSPAAAGGTDLDHVTALDRLRLHVHDPETFAFDYDDCVSLEEQIDAMLSASPSIGETVPGAGEAREYELRRRYWETIEELLKLVTPSALGAENRARFDAIKEDHSWDGLSCSCGGGWLMGHANGCPEAQTAPPLASTQEGEAP